MTASPARLEPLKIPSATPAFDYASSTVASDNAAAVNALGQGLISHAPDAVGTPSLVDLVLQSVMSPAAILASGRKFDGGFGMPVVYAKDSWRIQPPGVAHAINTPARPEDHWRPWKALRWMVEDYGSRFEIPNTKGFKGAVDDALRVIIKVDEFGKGLRKLNI